MIGKALLFGITLAPLMWDGADIYDVAAMWILFYLFSKLIPITN